MVDPRFCNIHSFQGIQQCKEADNSAPRSVSCGCSSSLVPRIGRVRNAVPALVDGSHTVDNKFKTFGILYIMVQMGRGSRGSSALNDAAVIAVP